MLWRCRLRFLFVLYIRRRLCMIMSDCSCRLLLRMMVLVQCWIVVGWRL